MNTWQRFFNPVLNAVFASGCGMCDRPTADPLCPDCHRQLHRCQWSEPQGFWHGSLPLFTWGHYAGALRQGIAALKYENQPQLAHLFGQWLGERWLASPMGKGVQGRSTKIWQNQTLAVVPVPANAAKRKRRGYDQAELLARAFCQYTHLPLNLRCVIRTEDTAPMYGLSLQERRQNVEGKFQLHPRMAHLTQRRRNRKGSHAAKAILLLDDIYTTGSTLNAIAHLLRQHHMPVYGAITLAKASLENHSVS